MIPPGIISLGTDIRSSLSTVLPFLELLSTTGKLDSRAIAAPGIVDSGGDGRMVMRAKDALGREGEQAAVEYLQGCGFRILDRNWRCDGGELDIVAVDRHVLVACEVKSRSGTRYGSPLDAVGKAKQKRLRRLAVAWINA